MLYNYVMENLQEKLDKALDLINEDDFSGAQKLLNEILEVEPNNIEALKNLGLCEINLDNPPDAIKYFARAVQIDNEDATSLYYLASCLSRVGDKENALKTFEMVLQLRPDYVEVYKNEIEPNENEFEI